MLNYRIWEPKDQPLCVYWARQYGLLLETVVERETFESPDWLYVIFFLAVGAGPAFGGAGPIWQHIYCNVLLCMFVAQLRAIGPIGLRPALVLNIGPRPNCQNKKCTCVNNRCIRSKISGDNLVGRRVELSANVTLARSRWMSNYYITPATGSSDQLEFRAWSQWFQIELWEPALSRELGPQCPGWAAKENEKDALLWPEELGWGQYVAVFVQSPAHLSHTTLSNKVRGIFF